MTKRELFVATIAVLEGREVDVDRTALLEGLAHEVELLDNRKDKTSSSKSKTQKENEAIKEVILATLADMPSPVTVSDLITTSALSEYSNQKISALLRQLVDAQKVIKTFEKKKALFSLAPSSEGEEDGLMKDDAE